MCRGLKEVFSAGIAMLNTLPKEHRLFARILYTKDQCALINRNLFAVPAILATAIARQKQETFRHYYIANTPNAIKLCKIVEEYFEARRKVTNLGNLRADEQIVGAKEQEQFYKIILKKLEKEIDEEESLAPPTSHFPLVMAP